MSIQILSEVVSAQIAAGEVVERPASVVKEIIENALDAGATQIEIEVRGAGNKLIRISDNGRGIPSAEVELALQRHATSKLRALEDLYNLYTLGFRGEALHSIASVSRLTLTTRYHEERSGTRLIVEGGKILTKQGVGTPPGTIIEVAELFYNVPARRKFLKSDATERRHITTIATEYAMAYPDVQFYLTMDGREAFHSSGNGNLADVVAEVVGMETFREMVEVAPLPPIRDDLPAIEVMGFVTAPHVHRANRSQIMLFVNGRAINDQRLTYAVVQAYHTLLPAARYPLAVLLIQVPPADVDVNVHPTKAEVRFRHPDAVFSAVQRAVRYAVLQQANPPDIAFTSTTTTPYESSNAVFSASAKPSVYPTTARPTDEQLHLDLETTAPGRYRQQLPPQPSSSTTETDDDEAFYPHYEAPTPPHLQKPTTPIDPLAIPEGLGKPKRPRTLPILRVVGQIGATYIVAEGPAGMYLIDQHAAHERILFEQLLADYHAHHVTAQHTLEGEFVELAPIYAQLLEEYIPLLNSLGFAIEAFGVNTFRILSVPSILTDRDPPTVIKEIVQDLESGKKPADQTVEAKILKRVCKAAAVKAGQILSYEEMQGIIHQLERCENPHTCPHGRPTMIHLSTSQLESQFKRG